MSDFIVTIPNLPKLQEALAQYPAIAAPIITSALAAAQAYLAKAKGVADLPRKSNSLFNRWSFTSNSSQAMYWPIVNYAPFVEFGTAPHVILPSGKQALFWPGADHPVKSVHHPGTAANPFMERIVQAAQPDITALFGQALDKITAQIASSSQ